MNERRLREQLRGVRVPGEDDAFARARTAALAAHAGAATSRSADAAPRRAWARPALAALLLAIAAAVGALTTPGQAVGEWLRDAIVHPAAPAPRPAAALPSGGRLLAGGADGIALIGGGAPALVGPYREAAWSPQGRFAAVVTGRRLLAVTPAGTVRWRVTAAAPPRHPRWAPDGFRIAYLAGPQLRVVVGDGSDDRLFWGHALDVAPAFRPGRDRTVAWVDSTRRIRVADVDRAVLDWRSPEAVPRGTRSLSWSADGRRILAAGPHATTVFTVAGGARTFPSRARIAAAAYPPSGSGPPAVLTRRRGRSAIRLLGSSVALIATRGRYEGLVWSPDGRWLVTRWGTRWLVVRADGRRMVTRAAHGTPLAWTR